MERPDERGFTLVDVLVGIAISIVILAMMVTFAARISAAASALETSTKASDAVQRLDERLESEAAGAWAIYLPATDVDGANNADGHEVAFYTEDGAHRSYAWAYLFDPRAKTVTRYDYGGAAARATETFSPIDAFYGVSVAASQAGAHDPLFAGARATDVVYALPAFPAAKGGNALVSLEISSDTTHRTQLLASATAPTTFTVIVPYTPSPSPRITPTVTPLAITTPTP